MPSRPEINTRVAQPSLDHFNKLMIKHKQVNPEIKQVN